MNGRHRSMTMAPEPRRGLNVAFETISRRTLQYEQDIQDFESRLAINLSNSRAISTLLHESQSAVKHYQQKADSALESTLPHIEQSLSEDINSLEFLDEHLPRIEEELVSIRRVYDRGQDKAVEHIAELEWLNTPLTARLRRTIFTASAPVSPRTKALLRMLFTLVFCMGVWVAWIALEGAVRAHRQRLVWGERLLS